MIAAVNENERLWFGQPRGLTILFLTEMWEKFSYYGMRALLVLYMINGLHMSPMRASLIYGAYTAAAYFTPVVGGVIIDRWLGARRAVILGAALMALGHFIMAFEPLFYVALTVIALGNGFYLPGLPSQIRTLYAADDPRREAGYTVYYAGINLGAFLAPLVCGTLGEFLGWHWGFGAAGVGMVCGLAVFMMGQPLLPSPPKAVAAASTTFTSAWVLSPRQAMVLLGVVLAVIVFRGAYEQVGNSVALWTSQGVDRGVGGGLTIPITWFQSLNPLMIFALAPLAVARMSRRPAGAETGAIRMMTSGALITAAAFALLAIAAAIKGGDAVPWAWLAAFFVLYTWGELHILPVGLALFARLSPPNLQATGIAVWFSAIFAGNLFAGGVGVFYGVLGPSRFFVLATLIALVSAGLLSLLRGPVRRLEQARAEGERTAVSSQTAP